MTGVQWPSQSIEEIKKTPQWYAQIGDFAQELLKNYDQKSSKMNRMYRGYNGLTKNESVKYLTDTYGWTNKTKYIDYRAGRTKIDILHGEYLKIPLNSNVRTINSEAIVRKLEEYDINVGAAHAKGDIEKLRTIGVDPMEGMDIPDPKDKDFKEKIKPKDRYEIIMQRIINYLIQDLDLVEKFGSNFLDSEITARMCSQIVVDPNTGSIDLEPFDPRDGIWFEFDKDPFIKRSFLMGRRKRMSINEVLVKFNLTDEQRTKLEAVRSNFNDYINNNDKNPQMQGKYSIINGEYTVEVLHIEWMGLKNKYTKTSPKTKKQMEFSSPDDGFLDLDITPQSYESNKEKIDKESSKNGQKVVREYTEELYQLTRIGHDLDIECGIKPFTMKDEDTGTPMFSYSACVIKSVDGEAISLQEIIENFSAQFNAVMFQIFREVSKMKGKVLGFNKGMLGKGDSVKKLLYKMLNDSLFEYSSAGQTNMAGKDLDITNMLKEFDLGLSNSFPQLLALKNDILQMLDFMTGINNERVGQIQASSTVSNAQQAIEASRTITEALFYYNHRYNENVLMKLAETAKIVYGLYNPDKLRTILGDEDFSYIMSTEGLADQKYGVYLTNGRREGELMQELRKYVDAYANSKELRFIDVMNVLFSDSVTAAKNFAQEGWNIVQKVRQDEQAAAQQAQGGMQQQQLATQIQIAKEDREDKQMHEMEKERLKIRGVIANTTLKAKNDAILATHQNELDLLTPENQEEGQISEQPAQPLP
ncbi:MAG: hypothetical protein IT212_07665 [Bacteroidia bacterium]|nr:hypothetical protein [Bacteroidia bacterium]